MKYKGYWLCSKTESSKFLQLYHSLTSLYSNIIFTILSFEECGQVLQEKSSDLHIIIAELSSQDEPEIWFPLISRLSDAYPHLKIIIILTGKPEHNFYYLNQLSFPYLIPENQVSELFPRGMKNAMDELCSNNIYQLKKQITSNPDYYLLYIFLQIICVIRETRDVISTIRTAGLNIHAFPSKIFFPNFLSIFYRYIKHM